MVREEAALEERVADLFPGPLSARKMDQALAEEILRGLRSLLSCLEKEELTPERKQEIQFFRARLAPILQGHHQQLLERGGRYLVVEGLKSAGAYYTLLATLVIFISRFPALLLLTPLAFVGQMAFLLYLQARRRGSQYHEKDLFFKEFEALYESLEKPLQRLAIPAFEKRVDIFLAVRTKVKELSDTMSELDVPGWSTQILLPFSADALQRRVAQLPQKIKTLAEQLENQTLSQQIQDISAEFQARLENHSLKEALALWQDLNKNLDGKMEEAIQQLLSAHEADPYRSSGPL